MKHLPETTPTRLNSGFSRVPDIGEFAWNFTEMAPADCPKIVTLSGSPPKFPILSCTHSSAIFWSRTPIFPVNVYRLKRNRTLTSNDIILQRQKAESAKSVIDNNEDNIGSWAEVFPGVPVWMPISSERASMDPNENRLRVSLVILTCRVHINVQTVLALRQAPALEWL